jgi:hypothetical protein
MIENTVVAVIETFIELFITKEEEKNSRSKEMKMTRKHNLKTQTTKRNTKEKKETNHK